MNNITTSPPGIGSHIWSDWRLRLASATGASQLWEIAVEMHQKLQTLQDHTEMWRKAAPRCMDLMWNYLDQRHQRDMPEMMCQRSGRCCVKGVPRVSLFELEQMVDYINELPEDKKKVLVENCKKSVEAKYEDPILGIGVPCPMLIKGEDGRHACGVHAQRPVICRVSGVSGQLSWDCPLWQVAEKHFPTLEPEIVAPFLEVFNYCRNFYAFLILKDETLCQMSLIGTGVLSFLKETVSSYQHDEVVSLYGHNMRYSPELFFHKLPLPPEEVTNSI